MLFEWRVFPWLVSEEWIGRLGIVPKLREHITVIERKESVSITQDENIERLVAEHGSVVVGVLEATGSTTQSPSLALARTKIFSGTLLTNDGLIATYRETAPISGVDRFTIFFADGRFEEAQVVGYDTLLNLLYLRTNLPNTPTAAFTNSSDIKSGRRVALLARTAETQVAVTPAVVENVNRTKNLAFQTVALSEEWEGVLDLDTAFAGNFIGSPAFLLNGELAGILGQSVRSGVTSSFLLPMNAVRESLDRLIGNRLARPTTGIYYLSLTPASSQILGLNRDRGAMVYSPSERTGLSVLAGSPAARAGLQFGDIIIAVNGAEINLDLPLSVALGRFSPGDGVTLLVIRNGVEREIELAL